MKFSAALSLVVAPLALAKAVHNVYPVRRDDLVARKNEDNNKNSNNRNNNNNKGTGVGGNSILVGEASLAAEQAFLLGQQIGAAQSANQIALLQQALLLWVFPGGQSQATTIINIQPAATVAPVAGGAAPPAQVTPPAAAPAAPAAPGTPTTPETASPGTAAPGTGKTHAVDVGKGGLAFSPNDIQANVGDTILFTFVNANHTVTQSAFDTPCDPLAGGMDTGFQPNPNGTVNPPPQVAMQVQVTTPLWFFCLQNGHCGKGMVLSVNPTADKTQALFQSKAIQQKGTGAGGAITGNGGAAAGNGTAAAPAAPAVPPAEGGAAASSAAAVGGAASLTATLGSGAAAPTNAASPGLTTGTGQIGTNGECICAVQCAAGSFASAQQGINAFGGIPGAIPASQAMII